jgi:glucokinase
MSTFILGIDLGGTKVQSAVLDESGKIMGRGRAKTEAWREDHEVFGTIVAVGRQALAEAGLEDSSLAALGIGSPGPLDPERGYIIESSNLNFRDYPLGPNLSAEFGCPARVENDVSSGVYGEFCVGAARGARDVLGMFIGTGIGGGIVLGGELYRGYSKNAAEVGHAIVEIDGPICGCGARGCLEAIGSRSGITRQIRDAIKKGRRTIVAKQLKKANSTLTGNDLREAYDQGDALVVKMLRRAAKAIGLGVGSMANVLGPELVVLGGGLIEAMPDSFIERISKFARRIAVGFEAEDLKIVRAQLGDDAGVIGAAILAKEKFVGTGRAHAG